jgi:hypothetical protein
MSEKAGKKSFNIMNVDLNAGYVDVQYTYVEDNFVYDPIWLTLPLPEKKNELDETDKEKIIQLAKSKFPLNDFLYHRSKQKLEPIFDKEEVYEVQDGDFQKATVETIDKGELTQDHLTSYYGSLEEVAKIRHIVLDILTDLGIIK